MPPVGTDATLPHPSPGPVAAEAVPPRSPPPLVAAAVLPHPPLLVGELAGGAAAELDPLRSWARPT